MPENNHELEQFKKKWECIADIIDIQKLSDMNPKRAIIWDGGQFLCDQPYKRILVDRNGELKPCFFAQYQISSPIYFGKDYSTLMDYWNSDWHRAFCDNIEKGQYNEICERCRESYNN
jgi:MoaA/NifB/PqqE/SkfB family radical SAM enzyme